MEFIASAVMAIWLAFIGVFGFGPTEPVVEIEPAERVPVETVPTVTPEVAIPTPIPTNTNVPAPAVVTAKEVTPSSSVPVPDVATSITANDVAPIEVETATPPKTIEETTVVQTTPVPIENQIEYERTEETEARAQDSCADEILGNRCDFFGVNGESLVGTCQAIDTSLTCAPNNLPPQTN